jgi:hypothetical protein
MPHGRCVKNSHASGSLLANHMCCVRVWGAVGGAAPTAGKAGLCRPEDGAQARRVAPQGDTAPSHARRPARALEPLSKHGTGCASRVCEVVDKPRQRRVNVWRVLSLRRPPVQHHRTRATAQPHVCLRLGVEPAVWAGGCGAHPDFPFRLPLPSALCPPATTSWRVCWPVRWRAVTGEGEYRGA